MTGIHMKVVEEKIKYSTYAYKFIHVFVFGKI